MTDTEIAELRRLEAEATPGPWDVSGLTVYDTCMDGVASTHSASDAALIVALRNALPELLKAVEEATPSKEGLSPWPGWDSSRDPWSQSKHQDQVCRAVFGDTWSMEDAHTLISFINRTWGAPLPPHGGVDVG